MFGILFICFTLSVLLRYPVAVPGRFLSFQSFRHLPTAATRAKKKTPLESSKGVNLRGTTLVRRYTLPQNALTGAPGTAYLSTIRLRDHVQPALSVPTLTCLGSLTGETHLLFSSSPLDISVIIPTKPMFCQQVNRKSFG